MNNNHHPQHQQQQQQQLKNIVVVGGTHGNEYTGVWCIKALDRQSQQIQTQYPSLDVSTLLGNPQAHMANKRFLHEDLNRQFSKEALQMAYSHHLDASHYLSSQKYHDKDDTTTTTLPLEIKRAREIDQILGPKFKFDAPTPSSSTGTAMMAHGTPAAHVVIDLHSTTSNMGLTIIVAEGDVVMTRAAAYVLHKCTEAMSGGRERVHCLVHTHASREARPNLSSTGQHGFTIEVGPVPQGVLRHDAVEKTQLALHAMLEYIHLHNTDRERLDDILKKMYEGSSLRVPCFRSASAVRKGEMSGKITWPCVPENPNFPAYMVHKDLQDADFELVKTGDPIFVDLDGNVICYDGSYGPSVYLMFVNEAGYYYESSGTGVSVAIKTEYDLETGRLLEIRDEL
eukprot:CAMPEP_0176504896 /NCGR_PEP_ID=MMETSP0200_2-20121128/16197_1 /TAXON_ID=947934 /ORGANISM="Chaetoceros sp., Strain GSL56" /LENGTH=397 /DNA_ID=CAMNT_0017904397 /DNA_START=307 /DNA_END=1500 /DNA_ORIENTATION=+